MLDEMEDIVINSSAQKVFMFRSCLPKQGHLVLVRGLGVLTTPRLWKCSFLNIINTLSFFLRYYYLDEYFNLGFYLVGGLWRDKIQRKIFFRVVVLDSPWVISHWV